MGRKRTGRKSGAPYGSRNGASKLTEASVRDIRSRHLTYINTGELAEEFNVRRETINAIARGSIWGWLE